MGIFQQFPYSNFHEMNLDQIIKIMREMQDEWTNTKAEWASYKEFIDNYFANLDLDEETEKALRNLVADGTLDPVIDPVIAAEVAAWLAEHITPTTPAIDDTLTVEGAAADAKATGDKINNIETLKNLVGKNPVNLLNRTKINNGHYLNSNGAVYTYNGYGITDYIPIEEGETIKITTGTDGSMYHCFYDENYRFISSIVSTNTSVTGPTNSKFVRFSIKTTLPELMIYKGAVPSKFIPYNPINGYIGVGVPVTPSKHYICSDNQILSKMTKIATNYEDGIFGASVEDTKTSDYISIDITNKDYYFVFGSNYSSYYDAVRFYDKDKNQIEHISGNIPESERNIPVRLVFPPSCQYVKFSQYANVLTTAGIYLGYATSFEKSVAEASANVYTDTNYVLWLGTSIPENSSYPTKACEANGYSCINKSLGSSRLCFTNIHPETVTNTSGRCLTATVAELEALYRSDVLGGIITEETLTQWKNYSYENSVIPYINGTAATQVSMIVIDHGFNDKGAISDQLEDEENIDYTSTDRSTFTGAFRYLLNQIQAIKPTIKIVIAGYFQNTIDRLGGDGYLGPQICHMQEIIGKHYSISVMKAWEDTQINGDFVAGSSTYLTWFNSEYGTSYTPMETDGSGNIPALQIYCPDRIHPHSDRTGNCDRRLNAVYTKLLSHMI